MEKTLAYPDHYVRWFYEGPFSLFIHYRGEKVTYDIRYEKKRLWIGKDGKPKFHDL